MKKLNRKQLVKGLKKIQKKINPHLSKNERKIFLLTIDELKKKGDWIKTVRKVLKTIVAIALKMF